MEQMEMHPVVSSNLRAIGYDAERETLRVEFRNGARCEYVGVPAALFAELQVAPSKGGFLHGKVIRGGFACRKLEPLARTAAERGGNLGGGASC